MIRFDPTEDDMSGGDPLWFLRAVIGPNPQGRSCPVWRHGDGPSQRPGNKTGVKLGKANPRTVVETRARSNALVCFDDGGGWRAQQTDALHL